MLNMHHKTINAIHKKIFNHQNATVLRYSENQKIDVHLSNETKPKHQQNQETTSLIEALNITILFI